ncbi:MAG: dUTP diphosphatase [bacterium]
MKIKIEKLHPNAKMPVFAHKGDAGADLFTTEEIVLFPGDRAVAPTGLKMEIPVGYTGLIWDKSGLAVKKGIKTIGGVVDAGYCGEVCVALINLSKEEQKFEVGDKVGQMIVQKREEVEFEEGQIESETTRGAGGFGSTGKN